MKDTDDEQGSAVAIGIGAFALTFLFAGLALAIYPSWQSIGVWAKQADAPAWVQAFGSIGAILAAISVAAWKWSTEQRRIRINELDAKEAAKKLHRQRVQMMMTAVGHVRAVSKTLQERHRKSATVSVTRYGDERAIQHHLGRLLEYCERVPIWSLENSTLARRWSGILLAVADAEWTAETDSQEVVKALDTVIQRCRSFVDEFHDPIDELLAEGEDRGWHLE